MNKNYSGLKSKLSILAVVAMIAIIGVGSFSCASSEIADSKDVNQAKIYYSYSVVYDASTGGDYTVTTQFRFGGSKGTTLRLSEPSKVFVNDIQMNQNSDSFSGCYYQSSVSGTDEFTIKFIDTESKEYINTAKITPIEAKPVEIIIADSKTTIYIIGLPLAENETATLVIEDNEGNRAEASSNIVGSDNVVITAEDMQNIVAGKAELYISRTKSVDLSQKADEGGSFYTEYKSKKIAIEIKRVAVPKSVK